MIRETFPRPRHDPADEAWVVRMACALRGADLADDFTRAAAYVHAAIPSREVTDARDAEAQRYERIRCIMVRMSA